MSASPNVQPGHVEAGIPYAQWNAYSTPTLHEAPASYPVEVGQEPFPDSDKEPAFFDPSPTIKKQSMPHQVPQQLEQNWVPQPMSQSSGWTPMPAPMRPFSQAVYTPATLQRSQRTMRIGFTAAGICLIAGALILTFVSIMAQPLLSSNSSQATITNARNTPPATASPSPTVPTPTPSEIFPGAQYITNARMASAVNENTAQATQYATSFTANQNIYVTFTLNTESQSGAVCLRWYMNNQYANHYEFSVGKNLTYNSYSYTSMSTPGTGYVEVYWASTVACTDKLLAQHVTFTVS